MQRHFEEVQTAIRDGKWRMISKRAMEIQKRAKIKPTIMNPDLLTMSRIRGGVYPVIDSVGPLPSTLPGPSRQNPSWDTLNPSNPGLVIPPPVPNYDPLGLRDSLPSTLPGPARQNPAWDTLNAYNSRLAIPPPVPGYDPLGLRGSRIRGGDAIDTDPPLNLYWPSS